MSHKAYQSLTERYQSALTLLAAGDAPGALAVLQLDPLDGSMLQYRSIADRIRGKEGILDGVDIHYKRPVNHRAGQQHELEVDVEPHP